MIIEQHFGVLQTKHPDATLQQNTDGSQVIIVPNLGLPRGWNRANVSVAFLAPAGYPLASPDCFWTEPELALEHGGIPQNTGQNEAAGIPHGWLWFSWHPSAWDANGSDLGTYLNVIRQRFHELR